MNYDNLPFVIEFELNSTEMNYYLLSVFHLMCVGRMISFESQLEWAL